MYRTAIKELKNWKDSPFRKPLVLQGARQVGKTWLVREFGKSHYARTIYINFEETTTLQHLFSTDYDVKRILSVLEIHSGIKIDAKETLIIFDELQAIAGGITALKYFNENAPQFHLIAAGSYLGLNLHEKASFPVGQVDFMTLRPLSFQEFLIAAGEASLAELLQKRNWEVIQMFTEKLSSWLRYYFFVGGMPEAVSVFIESRNLEKVRHIQYRLLQAYEADFSKHVPYELVPRIRMVWQSIPAQLAKENKKFVYGLLKEGARASQFELAIQWLVDSGLLLKCHRIAAPRLPLAAYQDFSTFKLFMHDTGLLAALSGLHATTIIGGDLIFTEFKGALTEQFVMQQLRLNAHQYIGYWTNDRSTAEVDFIVQSDTGIIPIEVKSGENTKAKSFRLFCEKYNPEKAIRVSLNNYRKESWMINVPLYAIDEVLDF